MAEPKFLAQVGNVYFLSRIGATLRQATSEIAQEALPPDIQRLLRRLERLEDQQALKAQRRKRRSPARDLTKQAPPRSPVSRKGNRALFPEWHKGDE